MLPAGLEQLSGGPLKARRAIIEACWVAGCFERPIEEFCWWPGGKPETAREAPLLPLCAMNGSGSLLLLPFRGGWDPGGPSPQAYLHASFALSSLFDVSPCCLFGEAVIGLLEALSCRTKGSLFRSRAALKSLLHSGHYHLGLARSVLEDRCGNCLEGKRKEGSLNRAVPNRQSRHPVSNQSKVLNADIYSYLQSGVDDEPYHAEGS